MIIEDLNGNFLLVTDHKEAFMQAQLFVVYSEDQKKLAKTRRGKVFNYDPKFHAYWVHIYEQLKALNNG